EMCRPRGRGSEARQRGRWAEYLSKGSNPPTKSRARIVPSARARPRRAHGGTCSDPSRGGGHADNGEIIQAGPSGDGGTGCPPSDRPLEDIHQNVRIVRWW